ncbi:MAG: AmmeMemoRadiSam system radical SAM enzyme [Acidobacteriota bacterium]|nr:MAG: AmmeMemoRadiSam system radical SAM enzyme [Acidobacteriota bacterium]
MLESDIEWRRFCSGHSLDRRRFLRMLAASAVGLSCSPFPCHLAAAGVVQNVIGEPDSTTSLDEILRQAPVARHWVGSNDPKADCQSCHDSGERMDSREPQHDQGHVRCLLCARQCRLAEGERGMCRARINTGGKLRTLVYGRPITVHVDPIEKKPFYHFLPGTEAFSLATSGCPLRCKFCQNWEISQSRPEDYSSPFTQPERVVEVTQNRKVPIIAFTYNEPTVFFEYLIEIAKAARKRRIHSVLISCGFMNELPLDEMCDVLSAIKIDLKGFSPDFYRDVCSAELQPVLRSIKQVHRRGVHLEIVNLVVPTLNDSEVMLTELVKWVAGELGPDVPVHFTRFHPDYKLLNLPPTPIRTLERAYQIARDAGLHFPFVGNVPGHPGNSSYCPKCGQVVVERSGFFVSRSHLEEGRCENCRESIAGIWRPEDL